MDRKKIYVTKDGIEELKKELVELKNVKRLEVVERVARAREMGDLSENSEYTAARDELSLVDGRVEELEEILRNVAVITEDQTGASKGAVQLGSKVKLQVSGKHEEFTVVGEWEADPHDRKISHESPLGKALIGRKPGDKVEVNAPAGKILYTVVAIN